MKKFKNFTLTLKIFISSVTLCFIALSIMALINYTQTYKRIKRNHQTNFNKKEQIVLRSFNYFIKDSNNFKLEKIENKLIELSKVNKLVVEFYYTDYQLVVNSLGAKKNKKIDPKIIKQLSYKNNLIIDSIKNEVRTYSFNKVFVDGEFKGVFSIIYFKNNHLLNYEVKQLFKQYIFLMLFLIFLSAFLAWIISNNLTKKIKEISEKLLNTDIFSTDNELSYPFKDEVTPLITSYNIMLKKIEYQKEIISKAEREETWKEIAKQVAHEINNPLTPMKLSIQDFKNKFETNDTSENKKKVNELSDMLLQQIDLIATISKSFTNFSKMPVKKDEYLEIISITKSLLFIYSGNNIDFNFQNENIYIKFDKLFYIRILTNLIKNAIQASENIENSKIIINIAELNDLISISIQDFGLGIKEENKLKIFNQNFTTKNTGLGIGLAMVKEIIESYNGKIWFESKENLGTTFFIEFNSNI
jgi:two-component system nitrogen regulation sensor histidine kinase NtrY